MSNFIEFHSSPELSEKKNQYPTHLNPKYQ